MLTRVHSQNGPVHQWKPVSVDNMAVGAGRWGSYKSSGFVTIREAVVLYAYLASVAVVVVLSYAW